MGEMGDFSPSWYPRGHCSVVAGGTPQHPGVLQPPPKAVWTGRDAMGCSPAPDGCCVAGPGDIPRPLSQAPQTSG